MTAATKAELAAQLQAARDELAAARDLLQAICQAADVPANNDDDERPRYQNHMMCRLIAINICARIPAGSNLYIYRGRMDTLYHELKKPLPYEPYQAPDDVDDVDEPAGVPA